MKPVFFDFMKPLKRQLDQYKLQIKSTTVTTEVIAQNE